MTIRQGFLLTTALAVLLSLGGVRRLICAPFTSIDWSMFVSGMKAVPWTIMTGEIPQGPVSGSELIGSFASLVLFSVLVSLAGFVFTFLWVKFSKDAPQ